jgi:3-methyladenine DNA glycosylase AlkC
MAEPLKNHFGAAIPRQIAAMIETVHPPFASSLFIKEALQGYEVLSLMQRGKKIAQALKSHLPQNYEKAVAILISSLGSRPMGDGTNPISSFLYLPHTVYVSEYGLDFFEASMQAQYELTQRFTAEFSIRPFLIHHERKTLSRLKIWAADKNVHVRRLVSEGTRPRLPWAQRLPAFQKNPMPVLELLEMLKDDTKLYVQRSVANNLNDIGKDHPGVLTKTCRDWMKNASKERQHLIRHALRFAIKRGNREALSVLGFGHKIEVSLRHVSIQPKHVRRGDCVLIEFEIVNTGKVQQDYLADLCLHYIKANGKTSPKVFKLNTFTLQAGQGIVCRKKISLGELTTRKHYPGKHRIEILLNGQAYAAGIFNLG